jgi:hypothetical protein
LKDLLNGLLRKNPDERLGSKNSVEVKNHHWFDGFNEKNILSKSIKAPFVPKVQNSEDISNFAE